MERAERTAGSRLGDLGPAGATPDAFRFGVETRIQVRVSHATSRWSCSVQAFMLARRELWVCHLLCTYFRAVFVHS
jgi:hypothetical protein